MPVLPDGTFVPSRPLTFAETHVDFVHLHQLILAGRVRVERAALPAARTVAASRALVGVTSSHALEDLTMRFAAALDTTANMAFRSARTEITRMRATRDTTARAALALPPPDRLHHAPSRDELRRRAMTRSRQAAAAVEVAVNQAALQPGLTQEERLAALVLAARRATHNTTLELVGDTVNTGRTAGAFSFDPPPEFAMRSEQLDGVTCDECHQMHGEIAQVDSSDYYDLLPPSYCMGGGRCRGVMVFGDGPVDLRAADDAELAA